ncbi:MAG: hypothetical protein KGN84_23175 [Acidobacteriota bacterium]|nr:hypothetical protein [Acidobacteriota bacterium]
MSPSTTPLHDVFVFDEEAFRRSIAYPLVTTNLKGVFHTPPPAKAFDPNKASAADLVKNGFLIRRPAASDPAENHAAWKRVFSRKWRPEDRIVPISEPQIGKTHILRRAVRKAVDTSYLGYQWAGGVIDTGKWTGVIGFWNIPTVSKPAEAQGTEGGWNSSSWIGIDGFNTATLVSNDVLQAGIQQRVDAQGHAHYVAWYEWYAPIQNNSPGYVYQTNISNFPVNPGQQVYCSVQYVNNGTAGSLYFANETTGQHFSITLAPPPGATFKGNTIEWIMEAPDGGEPVSSLPKFTPVQFTSCIGCGPSNAFGNPQNGDRVNVENTSNKVLTATTLGSSAVTVTFIG